MARGEGGRGVTDIVGVVAFLRVYIDIKSISAFIAVMHTVHEVSLSGMHECRRFAMSLRNGTH